jgi:hypothetical protein
MRLQHPETNTVMVSARDDDDGDGDDDDDDRTVLLVSIPYIQPCADTSAMIATAELFGSATRKAISSFVGPPSRCSTRVRGAPKHATTKQLLDRQNDLLDVRENDDSPTTEQRSQGEAGQGKGELQKQIHVRKQSKPHQGKRTYEWAGRVRSAT